MGYCRCAAVILSLLLFGVHAESKERAAQTILTAGEKYKADLVTVITHAERIVVVEHAFEPGPGGELNLDKQKVYATKELDKRQKAAFLTSVKKMKADVSDAAEDDACAFEPHHAIQFYDAAGWPRGTIEVSFECGEVFWEGSHGDVPAALAGTLEQLVMSVGLPPKRDWASLEKVEP